MIMNEQLGRTGLTHLEAEWPESGDEPFEVGLWGIDLLQILPPRKWPEKRWAFEYCQACYKSYLNIWSFRVVICQSLHLHFVHLLRHELLNLIDDWLEDLMNWITSRTVRPWISGSEEISYHVNSRQFASSLFAGSSGSFAIGKLTCHDLSGFARKLGFTSWSNCFMAVANAFVVRNAKNVCSPTISFTNSSNLLLTINEPARLPILIRLYHSIVVGVH